MSLSGSGHRIPCSGNENIPEVVFDTQTEFYDIGGHPIYVASALMGDSVQPCKYDILPITQDMEWVPTSNGGIPYGRTPVEGGYEGDNPLYHAYTQVHGAKVPGKTGAHLGGANIAFGGQELVFPSDYYIFPKVAAPCNCVEPARSVCRLTRRSPNRLALVLVPTMNFKWIVIVWAVLFPPVLGIWRRGLGQPVAAFAISDDRRDSRVARPVHEDLGAIGNKLNALKLHGERSDCFRDAASILYSSCESLDFEPSERVKVALATVAVEMTLCELATVEHVSLPLECKNTRTASTHRSVSQCVEALARSAQHWSSYSGYLREIRKGIAFNVLSYILIDLVAQLCTAYRRLHEIDHAKSIYANITDEKISFLSSLNGHYSELYLRQKELSGLTEGLESLIRARVVALSEDILADTRALNGHAFANASRCASMLSEVQRGFSLTTTNTQTNIEATIRSLDAVALSWNSRLVVFGQRLDVMWEETFDRKMALDQAIDDMRGRISQTDAQLELQLEATQKLQTLSSETSVSIERANFQLQSASNMLSQELETLASVTQELQTNVTRLPDLMFKFNPAWLPGILRPLSSIWSGLQFPAWQARLVMHVVGVGASGIQSSISALVTFGCALLFVMTHAFRYVSYLVGWLLPISREKGPSQSQNRPQILVTRSTHRRGQGNRSRLTSVLPRYETI
ncbi:unnamed protein product [Rhizoctonia solani]|uniref:Uncharacterized protein n=1 Tax=Rhizoctonia solani TaxID=456999 RepID=A0A8H3CEW3_9AGAM|nr:unnamed protein product [Rhizoctonia solani]